MLTPEQISDFVILTLNHFIRYKWTDISLQFPEYIASGVINEKSVKEFGGPQVSFTVQTRSTGLARNTGLHAPDVTGIEDLAVRATVPWTKQTSNWSYSPEEEDFQTDRETIVSIISMREHDCRSGLAELNETNMWSAPVATTDTRPMGVPFWLQKDASTTPEGAFNGGNPSGFTAGRAGLSTSDYSKWANWTFGYTNVTVDDMVRKVKKSLYETNFVAPDPHPQVGYGKAERKIYTTYRVREPLERLAESRNDNLGSDVAKYINTVTIGGVPVQSVHFLDANDSSDPLYGVNWKVFRPYVKRGWDMKRTVAQSPLQHLTKTVHYDTWMNYVCFNLRECFVGSKA